MTVPTESPAVIVYAANDLRIENVALPAPRADEAVIRVAFGGICGSDLHYWKYGAAGESVLRDPMILGHEVVGTVLFAAADGTGPAAGARVAVHPGTQGAGATRYPAGRPGADVARDHSRTRTGRLLSIQR